MAKRRNGKMVGGYAGAGTMALNAAYRILRSIIVHRLFWSSNFPAAVCAPSLSESVGSTAGTSPTAHPSIQLQRSNQWHRLSGSFSSVESSTSSSDEDISNNINRTKHYSQQAAPQEQQQQEEPPPVAAYRLQTLHEVDKSSLSTSGWLLRSGVSEV